MGEKHYDSPDSHQPSPGFTRGGNTEDLLNRQAGERGTKMTVRMERAKGRRTQRKARR